MNPAWLTERAADRLIRDDFLILAHDRGISFDDLAREHGLTIQRVQQIYATKAALIRERRARMPRLGEVME